MTARSQATPLPSTPVEASTVSVSVIDRGERRLDAETYLSEGYGLRQQIEGIAHVRLDRLARVWQPGRLRGVQVSPDNGTPFLAATQVFDIRPTPRKWLSLPRTPDVEERYVKRGWTLVTCSGSVGDAIMAYRPLDGMIVSHDLLRVVTARNEDRGFIYAYLRTRYARGMLRSTKYGNVIKHLEAEHLQAMPVVSTSESIKATLSMAIERCFALRDESHELMLEAEGLFEKVVGSIEAGSAEIGFTTRATELFRRSRRLDAYSHNPHTGAIIRALSRTKKPVVSLAEVTERIFLPNRFARGVPLRSGIPLVGSEELFQINPELDKFLPESVADPELYVQRGWLLVARSGQIYGINGRVVLADRWHESKVISDHAIRIIPGRIRPGYLLVVLGHPALGRPLVLREVYGTSIPELDPEALRDVSVLRLGELEDDIADKAERSAALRSLANEMENAAVALLESVIGNHLGTASEDVIDGAFARLRLIEIEADPHKVLSDDALEKRMERWES